MADPIETLGRAYAHVLGGSFDEEFAGLAEAEPWYSPALPPDEVYRLWAISNINGQSGSDWVYLPIRPSERSRLATAVGIAKEAMPGLTPQRLAKLVLEKCGIAMPVTWGHNKMVDSWSQIIARVAEGRDVECASVIRGIAERAVRQMLFFHATTNASIRHTFLAMISEDGDIRIPKVVRDALLDDTRNPEERVASTLQQDGWADLGMLCLLLRKLSSRCDKHGSGEILNHIDSERFLALAKALKPYAHDNPSASSTRKEHLVAALRDAHTSLVSLIQRQSLPNDLFVTEVGTSRIGTILRGIDDSGRQLTLLIDGATLAVGRRILYTVSAPCDYGRATWAYTPWQPIELPLPP
jgi:hypothetical protein